MVTAQPTRSTAATVVSDNCRPKPSNERSHRYQGYNYIEVRRQVVISSRRRRVIASGTTSYGTVAGLYVTKQVASPARSVGAPGYTAFERALTAVRTHVRPEVATLAGSVRAARLFAGVRLYSSVGTYMAANVTLPSSCIGAPRPRAFVRPFASVGALMLT